MRLRNLALAAAVATIPFTASAVTFDTSNNIAPGDTVDVSAAPFFFDASFDNDDEADIYEFEFTNNTLGVAALTVSEGTVLQQTLNFLDGVLISWVNGGASEFVPQGQGVFFELSTIVPAGGSDILRIAFGDPTSGDPRGRGDIDFSVDVEAIPLPASVLMLVGALGGLAFLGRRRSA